MKSIAATIAIAFTVLGALACAPADGDLEYALKCPQCGRNGLSLAAAAKAPTALHSSEIEQFGLFLGGAVQPICAPGTASISSCDIAAGWSDWKGGDPLRTELFNYVVKAALDAGYVVGDPMTGGSYIGMFGMAPSVASAPWTSLDRELVTASVALLTNGVPNVDICLATPTLDTCPASDYIYLELQAAGDLFDGSGRLVVGSPWAADPQMNARTCTAGAGSCPSMEDNLGYHTVGCTYTGVGQRRRATSCTSSVTGTSWANPVSAFVLQDPGSYYFGTPTPPTAFY